MASKENKVKGFIRTFLIDEGWAVVAINGGWRGGIWAYTWWLPRGVDLIPLPDSPTAEQYKAWNSQPRQYHEAISDMIAFRGGSDGKIQVLFIEAKTRTGTKQGLQGEFLALMQTMGAFCVAPQGWQAFRDWYQDKGL